MFKYSLLSYLVSEELLFFSHRLSVGLVLSRRTLAATALTISLLLKNTIDLLFFSEHKLYGFPLSVNKDYDNQI